MDRETLDSLNKETVIRLILSQAEAIEWTKRFVKVDAPGRHGAQSECELRRMFDLEDFAADPAGKPGSRRQVEQRLHNSSGL